ncbi:MAG: hypothetical protein M3328_05210, partial [Chloroflexota bacterium]|nr:hypothetical protein [Chloroflexota bacterium]
MMQRSKQFGRIIAGFLVLLVVILSIAGYFTSSVNTTFMKIGHGLNVAPAGPGEGEESARPPVRGVV